RIPGELSPSNYPGRHVARDEYLQRHVAREGVNVAGDSGKCCSDFFGRSMIIVERYPQPEAFSSNRQTTRTSGEKSNLDLGLHWTLTLIGQFSVYF
ncbi:hypothetical protein Tco_0129953, partial [Tanacetum coccineum]